MKVQVKANPKVRVKSLRVPVWVSSFIPSFFPFFFSMYHFHPDLSFHAQFWQNLGLEASDWDTLWIKSNDPKAFGL
jgi:hypothetical protein